MFFFRVYSHVIIRFSLLTNQPIAIGQCADINEEDDDDDDDVYTSINLCVNTNEKRTYIHRKCTSFFS